MLNAELIEEKRQSVKDEVDSIISQWQNVDIGEVVAKDTENSRRKETSRDRRSPEISKSSKEDKSDHAQKSSSAVTNGSWNTEDSATTWETENPAEQYSAKEQRMRTKLTGNAIEY